MEILTNWDELQEAMKKIDLSEDTMVFSRGKLVTESAAYDKMKKILGCLEMIKAHNYLYNLDPEQLSEEEVENIDRLYSLGTSRGFIKSDDECPECNAAAEEAPEKAPEADVQAQVAPAVPPAYLSSYKPKIPCWTVLYSACNKDGDIKTGECFSNSINPRSAKADCYAKLERCGYTNISILAIECGDPDSCGCDDVEEEAPEVEVRVSENDKLAASPSNGNAQHNGHIAEAKDVNETEDLIRDEVEVLIDRNPNGKEKLDNRFFKDFSDVDLNSDLQMHELKLALEYHRLSKNAYPAEHDGHSGKACKCGFNAKQMSENDKVDESVNAQFDDAEEALLFEIGDCKQILEMYDADSSEANAAMQKLQKAFIAAIEVCETPAENAYLIDLMKKEGFEVNDANVIVGIIDETCNLDESGNPYMAGMKTTDIGGMSSISAKGPSKPKKKKAAPKKAEVNEDDEESDNEESSDDSSDDSKEEPKEEKDDDSSSEESNDEDSYSEDSSSEETDEGSDDSSSDDASDSEDNGSDEDSSEDSDDNNDEDSAAEDSEDGDEDASSEEDSEDEESNEEDGESSEESDDEESDDAEDSESDEDADEESEVKELTDEEKAEMKGAYKKAFKDVMLKCKFEDKCFDDLSIKEKVEFFTKLNKEWKKNEPKDFMSDKEIEQLNKVVIKKA